jgi:hypothetical protein
MFVPYLLWDMFIRQKTSSIWYIFEVPYRSRVRTGTILMFFSVLWIRIRFNADLDRDPAFYLNADPAPDPGSPTKADPCGPGSWSHYTVTKSKNFYMGTKAFSKGGKPGLLVNFG